MTVGIVGDCGVTGSFTADSSACVTFPRVLAVDESLVSSISQAEGIEVRNVGALKSQAVLTAVTAPPPASALRPSYAGTYKKYLDSSKILWSRLPNLPAPASRPDGADLLRQADRPRVDHLSSWTIQDSCAEDNWYNGEGQHACYGREYATFVSEAALYVMLDTPEKRELATSLIQLGIDNYGVLKAGRQRWPPQRPQVAHERLLGRRDALHADAPVEGRLESRSLLRLRRPATPICDPAEAGAPDSGPDGTGAGPGGPDSGAAGAGADAANESNGCGCRTASLQAGSFAWLFLVGAAAMIARRRRTRR